MKKKEKKESHTISLSPEDWIFLESLVSNNIYASVSEAVRAFIREVKNKKVLEVKLT